MRAHARSHQHTHGCMCQAQENSAPMQHSTCRAPLSGWQTGGEHEAGEAGYTAAPLHDARIEARQNTAGSGSGLRAAGHHAHVQAALGRQRDRAPQLQRLLRCSVLRHHPCIISRTDTPRTPAQAPSAPSSTGDQRPRTGARTLRLQQRAAADQDLCVRPARGGGCHAWRSRAARLTGLQLEGEALAQAQQRNPGLLQGEPGGANI